MDLPEFPESAQVSLVSCCVFQLAVAETRNAIPRPQFPVDVGIDFQVEFAFNGRATGQLIGVQVKSTGDGQQKLLADGKAYSVHVEQRHINYWLGYSLPVFLVLYDDGKRCLCWVLIEKAGLFGSSGKTLHVPAENRLEGNYLEIWSMVAAKQNILPLTATRPSLESSKNSAQDPSRLIDLIDAMSYSARNLYPMKYADQMRYFWTAVSRFRSAEVRARLVAALLSMHYSMIIENCRRMYLENVTALEGAIEEAIAGHQSARIAVSVSARAVSAQLYAAADDLAADGALANATKVSDFADRVARRHVG